MKKLFLVLIGFMTLTVGGCVPVFWHGHGGFEHGGYHRHF